MILNKFGSGWQTLFEKRLQYIEETLAPTSIKNIERYRGMLRITFQTLDEPMQFVLDCVSYKIERESAKTCEKCGEFGMRRMNEWLEEPMCLCLPCYTLTVDEILNNKE